LLFGQNIDNMKKSINIIYVCQASGNKVKYLFDCDDEEANEEEI